MLRFNDLVTHLAMGYAIGVNPLPVLREDGYDTHFEYLNSTNLKFMFLQQEGDEYWNKLVVILETDSYKNPVSINVFLEGQHEEYKWPIGFSVFYPVED